MTGLIVTGGAHPPGEVRLRDDTGIFVCAADSGLETALRFGLPVHLIVGDMDSLTDTSLLEAYPGDRIERHPRRKDLTDTEIAVQALQDRGIEQFTLLGGGGGRLDHVIALLRIFERAYYPRCWLTDKEVVDCIDRSYEFRAARGETVSLFPVGPGKTRARSVGLRWALDDLEWDHCDVGISNEVTEDVCRVVVDQGRLLLVRTLPPVVLVP